MMPDLAITWMVSDLGRGDMEVAKVVCPVLLESHLQSMWEFWAWIVT